MPEMTPTRAVVRELVDVVIRHHDAWSDGCHECEAAIDAALDAARRETWRAGEPCDACNGYGTSVHRQGCPNQPSELADLRARLAASERIYASQERRLDQWRSDYAKLEARLAAVEAERDEWVATMNENIGLRERVEALAEALAAAVLEHEHCGTGDPGCTCKDLRILDAARAYRAARQA